MPNHVIWLLGGYLIFHSCLNISGELLFFADRDFYHDWWNSPNFSKFWQDWNLPVHRWFLRHIYKPLLAAGFVLKIIDKTDAHSPTPRDSGSSGKFTLFYQNINKPITYNI